MLAKSEVQATVTQYGANDSDTGCMDVQIALLSKRINYLTEHLKLSPKDHASRRGLLKLVGQRRRSLKYLLRTDGVRYQSVIESLGIRGLKSA